QVQPADLDRARDRRASERCRWPAGAARTRPHHGDLRPYRSRGCGSRQALCRQQSRLPQLSSPGRNEEVRHSAVRAVRSVSPLQRSLGGADHHRGAAQCLHDAEHERAAVAGGRAGDASAGGLYQIPVDRRRARAAAAGNGHRQHARARPRGRPRARRGELRQYLLACHGPDGAGIRRSLPTTDLGYMMPPLWGNDSFNDGAGMARLITAANFLHFNMPHGVDYLNPQLSPEQAWDIAAYVISQPRPHKAGLDKDFPDLLEKPVDAPYGPYADGFSEQQHKYGPFAPIRAALARLKAEKAGGQTPPPR